jgi:hypothetical protein
MGEESPQQRPRKAYTRLVTPPYHSLISYRSLGLFPTGYSIIDSLILFNGTLYIVTDRPGRWPSVDKISAVIPLAEERYKNELRFISPEEAGTLIPPLAGR